jgi:hypothetical protein
VYRKQQLIGIALALAIPLVVIAGNLTLPYVFTPGQPIRAAEINATLTAIQVAVNSKLDADAGFSCVPLSHHCEGDMLYTCTRSGRDEIGSNCADSSGSGYTYTCDPTCATSPKQGACCKYTSNTLPNVCQYALTNPAISGTNCTGPTVSTCALVPFSVSLYDSVGTCPARTYSVNLSFDRAKVQLGIAQPITNLDILSFSGQLADGGMDSCAYYGGSSSSIGGTLTLVSDLPNWKVSIDAGCLNPGIKLQGEFSGTSH